MAFSEAIIYLFNFSLGMTAVLAFIVILTAGIKIVESRGNPSEIQSAKQKIINSLIGLTIILTSYILLTTINPGIINIENISLGGTGITIPVITPDVDSEKAKNYNFQEIPIGTLTEAVLIGTSSKKNAVPCYEYEHKAYDGDQLIIGNTVDRNKDGKIDEGDLLLNKDMFYCIKLLDDAIKQKINVHLSSLVAGVKQLDELMRTNCSCKRAYYNPYPAEPKVGYVIFNGGNMCPYDPGGCPSGKSYCHCCGEADQGCSSIKPEDNTFTEIQSVYGYRRQYTYDTCDNRIAIDCKRQEIRQLMDGTRPDEICYHYTYNGKVLIEKEQPFNLLTIDDGVKRLNKFKEYYDNQVKALEEAEAKMKEAGEKLTLAELHNNVQTRENVSVSETMFQSSTSVYYNIARYCRESNCSKTETNEKEEKVCPKEDKEYEMSAKNRVCMMEATKKDIADKTAIGTACKKAEGLSEIDACKEYYSYSGDGATFYYSSEYDAATKAEKQIMDNTDKVCDIETQNVDNEMYGGLIRIGETVDYTEAWGKEVSKRIEKLKGEVEGMLSTGMEIYGFPDSCNGGNCTNGSENPNNICNHPRCDCDGDCCCPQVQGRPCQQCEANNLVCKYGTKEYENMEVLGNVTICPETQKTLYMGCSSFCCGASACVKKADMPKVDLHEEDYWTCPYRSLCMLMKDLYQRRPVERSCLEETNNISKADIEEETSRGIKRSKVGYVQKMEEREAILFELAQVKEIKDDEEYELVAAANLIGTVCPDYMILTPPPLPGIDCKEGLSKTISLSKRFDLFDMLSESRERLTGCVTGFNVPYKQSADKVRVMSCYEFVGTSLTITPNSPETEKAAENPPYINCYPYNSSSLTSAEKESCFRNINYVGNSKNPGCATITQNYMDNYYCCQ